jgi:methylglyoxal synthase
MKIALVAHDGTKGSLVEWAEHNRELLSSCEIWSTFTTGTQLESALGQSINKVLSGPYGGDMEIGALVARRELDLLVFFIDPLGAHPHVFDVYALIRVAMAADVPVATSRRAADIMITSPLLAPTLRKGA